MPLSKKTKARRQKAKEHQKLEKMKEVSEAYLKGWSLAKIGEHVGMSDMGVKKILDKLRDLWIAHSIINFEERKARELAKIDLLEEIAYRAWQRSTEDVTNTHRRVEKARIAKKTVDDNGRPAFEVSFEPIKETKEKKVLQSPGNPRFLERVAWCIETRLKIFGLLKPNEDGTKPGTQLVLPSDFWDRLAGHVPSSSQEIDTIEARIANPRITYANSQGAPTEETEPARPTEGGSGVLA